MTGLVASDLRPLVRQLDPEGASLLYAGEVRRRDEPGVPVGGDVPLPGDWQVERNVRARWTRGHRRRLNRVGDIAGICPHSELHRVRRHVANFAQDDERTSFQWWLDQRTCRGEDGQRDAEGDGPPHDAIVARQCGCIEGTPARAPPEGTLKLGSAGAPKSPVSRRWDVDNQWTFAPEGWVEALSCDRADVAVVDRNLPVVRERQVQGHRGSRWTCRHRRRLHRVAAGLATEVNRERHRFWPLVTDFNLNHVRPWRGRWFDQRTCSGQDGQREAEGDGPQHVAAQSLSDAVQADAVGDDLKLEERAPLPDERRDPWPRAVEVAVVVEDDRPFPTRRKVDRHVHRCSGRNHRRPHCVRENARRHRHADLGRLGRPVANPCGDRSCPSWHRLLDQRARRGQEGHCDADGDGPQHRAIVAPASKAQGTTSLGSLETAHCQVVMADLHADPTSLAGKFIDTIETTIDTATQPVEPAHAKDVILPDRQVQRHIGSHPGGHRLRLGGSLERPGGRHDGDLRRLPCRVSYLGPDRRRANWHRRRLDQRACSGQEGHRDAEGDGPQHGFSIAPACKPQVVT